MHSVEVVVVSFGCQEGASHWLQETSCQFDMLLDADRKVRGQHEAMLQKTKLFFFLIDKSTVMFNIAAVRRIWFGSVSEESVKLQ